MHAADLHLDSPLKGLEAYEGAPDIEEIRGATRQALTDDPDLEGMTISVVTPGENPSATHIEIANPNHHANQPL